MEELLKVDDVADRLRVSRRSVWKLVSMGKLPTPVKVLASSRWRRADIDAFITGLCGSAEAADKSLSQE
jgi:predicted DNA-binding transcriptional regulator AlpA